MTKKLEVYKCEICGNIVEVLHTGVGELVCCGQLMKLFEEKAGDQGQEKHVPVIERTGNEIKVKVGSVSHPMENEHYIEWIEVVDGEKVQRKFLNPGDRPESRFKVESEHVKARGFCNVHGLWTS